jgi:hypothetical protein
VERPTGAPGAADGLRVAVWRAQKGKETTLTTDTLDNLRSVHLQVSATDRSRFKFAVSSDGKNWKTLASDTEGGYLPPWDLAVRAALLVTGPDASAAFDTYTLAPPTGAMRP